MLVVEESSLVKIAEYDARLAAMLANQQNGEVPLSRHLQHFHELGRSNSASHVKLAEDYVFQVLDSTDDTKILSRLREQMTLHGLRLFNGKPAQQTIGELYDELSVINSHRSFFEDIVGDYQRLADADYTGIVNPGFGGFMGKQKDIFFPSMVQRYGIDRLERVRNLGAYLPVGTGKSAIGIIAGEKILRNNPGSKCLVLCTKASYDEFLKGIGGSDEERYLARIPPSYFFGPHRGFGLSRFRESDFIVINFEHLRATAGGGKFCFQLIQEEPWDFLVVDEPHVMRSSSSRRAEDVRNLLTIAQERGRYSIMLTGTATRDDYESLVSQVSFLDDGVGERLKRSEVGQVELLDFVDSRTIIFTDGMSDIKPLKQDVVEFELPPGARDVYSDLSRGRGWGATHRVNKFLVDFGSECSELAGIENPKLTQLIEKINGWIADEEDFLVYFPYTTGFLRPNEDGYCFGEAIRKLLGKNGSRIELFDPTGKDPMYRYKLFDRFRRDEGLSGLLIPKNCSLALNLQNAKHIIVPTPIEDPVLYTQLQGRINREGQEEIPDIYVFVYKGTVEEDRLSKLEERFKKSRLLKYFIIPEDLSRSLRPPQKSMERLGIVASRVCTQPPKVDRYETGFDEFRLTDEELTEAYSIEGSERRTSGSLLNRNRFQRLSRMEINDLALQAQGGDSESRNRLILSLIPLIKYLTRHFNIRKDAPLETDDLVGYGIFGVTDCIDRYDPTIADFESYVGRRILGAMQDAFRDVEGGTVSIHRGEFEKVRKWEKAEDGLKKELGREPEEREIEERSNIFRTDYREAKRCVNLGIVSFDSPSANNGDEHLDRWNLVDIEDPGYNNAENRDHINHILGYLEPREREVIRLYYFENLTLKDVGNRFCISESRACQIHNIALEKLRRFGVYAEKNEPLGMHDIELVAGLETLGVATHPTKGEDLDPKYVTDVGLCWGDLKSAFENKQLSWRREQTLSKLGYSGTIEDAQTEYRRLKARELESRELVTGTEAAILLGRNRDYVEVRAKGGCFESVYIGGKRFFRKDDILEWRARGS